MSADPSTEAEAEDPIVKVAKTTKSILADVRVVIGLATFFAVSLPGAGWLALSQIQSTARAEGRPIAEKQAVTDARVDVLEAKQAATDASVVEANKRSAAVERTVMVIDLNMRLLLESRGITPIKVPDAPIDGGRP